MKIVTILLLAVILISCTQSDDETGPSISLLSNLKSKRSIPFNESLNHWNELKKTNGDSYIYETTFVSWTGYGETTELTIENDIVVSRKYEGFVIDGASGQKEITDSYIELSSDLGSNNYGAEPRTIDELYQTCLKDILVADERNNTIYFETAANGLMTLCGYRPKNCADDCLFRVSIDAFAWIK